MHYLLAFVGAILGVLLGSDGGFLIGALLGFGAGFLWKQNTAIKGIEARLDSIEGPSAESPIAAAPVAPRPAGIGPVEADPVPPAEAPPPADPSGWTTPTEKSAPRQPSAFDKKLEVLRERAVKFVTTGNPVVRIGAIVLFIGVAYLLRYAYEHSLVPVELRLAGAGIGGIALLVLGWRLRGRTDTYGLILQGAGLAILYLTVFASSRLYELVPIGAAFVILVVLVAGASVLAVVQKSQALAIFSMSGGFLAPVLTSTGEGSHLALFSYYALLNAGILVMAWFQHWRWLNWTGFVFTFVIGASWGYQYYRPEHFASTQPFLILFFLFYVGVSVLFARRQTVELKGVIDGTLVFGTPVIAFALQAALVRDMPFGLAFSAVGAAAVYTALAILLKRQIRTVGLLGQSFVSLAAVFVTLAIPFAFDNQRFTAATWALEGAAIFWVGLRQAQMLPRAFGLLLQVAAGFAFAIEIGQPVGTTLFLNSAFLGAAFLGIAGIFTAFLIEQNRSELTRLEIPIGWILLGWGVLWWLSGGLREFALFTPGEARFTATNLGEHFFLTYAAVSIALLALIADRARWAGGLLPGFLLLPLAVVILANLDIGWDKGTALTDFGWLAWPVTVAVFVWHLRQVDHLDRFAVVWHAAGWWFATLFLTWNVAAVVEEVLSGSVWTYVLWGAMPLLACYGLLQLRGRQGWPFREFADAYFGWGWTVGLAYLLGWLLVTGFIAGNPDPLPYLVLVNPLELVQASILLLGVFWLRSMPDASPQRVPIGLIGGIAFIWINFVALRAVHFYAEVPYPVERIAESDAFQSTVTILWTSIALLLMGFGARRPIRLCWLIGAGLLGVVIFKLFLLDMSRLDLVARIISFITVGVLMLVIGYFAPIPPKRVEPAPAAAQRSLP